MSEYEDFVGDAYDPSTQEFSTEKAIKHAINSKGKCNIIICGATGVGKSTLINAVFGKEVVAAGKGKPVTQHLKKVDIPEKGLCLWDTKGIESEDYQGTINQLKSELSSELSKADNEKSLPHVGWVCIKGTSDRVENRDIDLIKILKDQGIPTVVVFTNVFSDDSKEFVKKAIKVIDEDLSDFVAGNYVSVNSEEYKITKDIKIAAEGLDDLVEVTLKRFPSGKASAKNAFLKAQRIRIKERLDGMKAGSKKIVHMASAAAGVVGASPIPGSDAPLIAAAQSTMIYKINAEFELDPDSSKMTSVLAGVMGVTALAQVGKAIVANALKFIPGAGTLIGGAISSSTAIALTEAVGHAYIATLEGFFDMESGKVVFPEESEMIISAFKNVFSFKK